MSAVGVDGVTPHPSWPARLLMVPIRAWRLASVHLTPRCRFTPSCSAYALEALAVHGVARGSWLAFRRLLRCHPWGGSGYDPVPPNTRSSAADPGPGAGLLREHADPT